MLSFNLIYSLEAVVACLKIVMGVALVHFQKHWLLSNVHHYSWPRENDWEIQFFD